MLRFLSFLHNVGVINTFDAERLSLLGALVLRCLPNLVQFSDPLKDVDCDTDTHHLNKDLHTYIMYLGDRVLAVCGVFCKMKVLDPFLPELKTEKG